MPADQLPAALKMAPRDWEQAYRSPKPCLDDWLVMQCRDNKRATWAAQIAQDQGWPRVLVHREVFRPLILKRFSNASEARRHVAPAGVLQSLQHTSPRKKYTTPYSSQLCMKLITLCRVCMGGGCTQQSGHMPAIRRESRLLSRSRFRVSPLMLDAQKLSLPSWGCVACSVTARSSGRQGGIMLA